MTVIELVPLLWLVVGAVVVMGLASAWMVRRDVGSAAHACWQCFYYFNLAIVGMATAAAMRLSYGGWSLLGFSLMGMVVTAVVDFGEKPQQETAGNAP